MVFHTLRVIFHTTRLLELLVLLLLMWDILFLVPALLLAVTPDSEVNTLALSLPLFASVPGMRILLHIIQLNEVRD